MLHLLDDALEALFRARVPLSPSDVDVTFGSPSADWAASVTRPTVNLFLWGSNLSAGQASSGMAQVEHEGRIVRRPPLPRIECSYLVTAWTSDIRDEHQLLGALLGVVLTEPCVSAEFLPEPLRSVLPLPTLAISRSETPRSAEFWSAVGGRLKPGLDLLVSATADYAVISEVGPPVTSEELTVRAGDAVSHRRRLASTEID